MSRRPALLFVSVVAACSGSREPARDRARDGMIEIVLAFTAKDDPHHHVRVDPAAVRQAVLDTGSEVYDVEAVVGTRDGEDVPAILLRVPLARPSAAAQEDAITALRLRFPGAITRAAWAGDRLFVRATQELPEADVRRLLDRFGFAVESEKTTSDTPGEVNVTVTVEGPEVGYARAIEERIGGVDAFVLRGESVGPQRRE